MQLPPVPADYQSEDHANFILGVVTIFVICSAIYYQIKKVMLVYGAANDLEAIQKNLREIERKIDYIMRNIHETRYRT